MNHPDIYCHCGQGLIIGHVGSYHLEPQNQVHHQWCHNCKQDFYYRAAVRIEYTLMPREETPCDD